jgi:hypothetical protein
MNRKLKIVLTFEAYRRETICCIGLLVAVSWRVVLMRRGKTSLKRYRTAHYIACVRVLVCRMKTDTDTDNTISLSHRTQVIPEE